MKLEVNENFQSITDLRTFVFILPTSNHKNSNEIGINNALRHVTSASVISQLLVRIFIFLPSKSVSHILVAGND